MRQRTGEEMRALQLAEQPEHVDPAGQVSEDASLSGEHRVSDPLPFDIRNFDGPLDLLSQLLEKNKVDIFDIPIVQITDQYLAVMGKLDAIDMDLASEFLVMASTLLKIKSQWLLPRKRDDKTGEEHDPRMNSL